MAHRYYNIPTCLNRRLCFEALEKKIEMVTWELKIGLITNYQSGLSQEIKELLENHHVRVSKEAHIMLENDLIWQDWFKNSKDFKQKSSEIKEHIQDKIPFSYGIWKYLDKKKVTWDHTVPTTVLVNRIIELYKTNSLKYETYSKLVEKYGFVTIITKEKEDGKLNEKGYRQKMPEDWQFGPNADPFARYKELGIEVYEK